MWLLRWRLPPQGGEGRSLIRQSGALSWVSLLGLWNQGLVRSVCSLHGAAQQPLSGLEGKVAVGHSVLLGGHLFSCLLPRCQLPSLLPETIRKLASDQMT